MEMVKKTPVSRWRIKMVTAILFSVFLFCTAFPCAFAESSGAQLVEKQISDWSFDYYFVIDKYSYDKDGRLSRTDHCAYQNDQFTDIAYEYGPETYDYYDNGQLRTEYGNGWEKHYDRYGISLDSPKPAVPNPAILVWYDESIDRKFDKDGNLVRLVADDTVYEYTYDNSGRILKVTSTDPMDDQLSFSYPAKGGYILHGEADNDYETYEYVEEYDNSGRLIRKTSSWDLGKSEETHKFSSDGDLETVRCRTEENGATIQEYTREIRKIRNAQGLLQREETWELAEAEDRILEKTEYEYDSRGNVSHVQKYQYMEEYSRYPILLRDERYTYNYDGTPTQTSSPRLGIKPSAADLDAINADIKYPRKSSYYLDEYIYTTVKYGTGLVYINPNASNVTSDSNTFDVHKGESVIILAEASDLACCIFPDLGRAGWIGVEYLSKY